MHEYSIIQSLVDSVEAAVFAEGSADPSLRSGLTVSTVKVRIGAVSGVDTYLLATAFEVFRAGTICERATMDIESVPANWVCEKCGVSTGNIVRCASCNAPARLESGDEIILQSIEMEVADV